MISSLARASLYTKVVSPPSSSSSSRSSKVRSDAAVVVEARRLVPRKHALSFILLRSVDGKVEKLTARRRRTAWTRALESVWFQITLSRHQLIDIPAR